MIQILTFASTVCKALEKIFFCIFWKKNSQTKNFVDGDKKGEVKPLRIDRSLPVYKSTYLNMLQIAGKKSIHFDFSFKALLFHPLLLGEKHGDTLLI